jgi:hypothetical protein
MARSGTSLPQVLIKHLQSASQVLIWKSSIELARQEEESNSSENLHNQDQIFFPSSSSGRPLQRTPSRRGSQSQRGSSRARSRYDSYEVLGNYLLSTYPYFSSTSQVSLHRVATANSRDQSQNTELQKLEEELKIQSIKAELPAKQIEIKKKERELRELELENEE